MDLTNAVSGFFSNLGFFAPAAALGWWIIHTQRSDLIKERDEARADLSKEREEARKRNDALTDRVIALAQSVERTMAEFIAAIRGKTL